MLEFGSEVGVKVCGVTNPEDAVACAEAGAEMLGLNFSPQSLRFISPARAAEVMAAVRAQYAPTKFVGVFVDQAIDFVRAVAQDLALDAIQLHGAEDADYLRQLNAPYVIKALRVGPEFSAGAARAYAAEAILLDSWSASARGGTGETFSWPVAAALRPLVRRLILAGGLTSENVTEAVRTVRPCAVDVCSGVETVPGRKDLQKVRHFLEAVRSVDRVKV